jgi:hypothetical protein
MLEIPTNITNLALENKKTNSNMPKKLKDLLEYDKIDCLTIEEKHDLIVTAFNFGDKFLENIMSENADGLTHSTDPEIEEFLAKFNNIGMLIIRPEMYHISAKIENFLNQKGLDILDTFNLPINYKQYLSLYRDVVKNPKAKFSMPTRTLTYTNGESRVIICIDRSPQNYTSLPDKIVKDFKGVGGVLSTEKQTIRGSIIYEEAIKLGFHELLDQTIREAIDPFGVLRLIVDFPQYQTDLAKSLAIPLTRLTYNAVSVHIPDQSEISRDMSTILEKDQIVNLSKMV